MAVTPVACALPPVTAPIGLLTGVVQVYVVPAGTIVVGALSTGITVKILSPQIVAVWAGITGDGSTVTVTVNGTPGQLPAKGVTVYVSVADVLVVLFNVWLMAVTPVACALPPVIAPAGVLTGVVHVYIVPAGTIVVGALSEGVTVNALPLQMVSAWLPISGVGSTVTITVNGAPGHPEAGITV